MTVTEGGKRYRRTKQEIMFTSFANNAAKGDIRSARFLLDLKNNYQDKNTSTIDTSLLDSDAKELIDAYLKQQSKPNVDVEPPHSEPIKTSEVKPNLTSQENSSYQKLTEGKS